MDRARRGPLADGHPSATAIFNHSLTFPGGERLFIGRCEGPIAARSTGTLAQDVKDSFWRSEATIRASIPAEQHCIDREKYPVAKFEAAHAKRSPSDAPAADAYADRHGLP